MTNAAAGVVAEDEVSRSRTRNRSTVAVLGRRAVREGHSKFGEDCHGETRAVNAITRSSTVDVGDTDPGLRIRDDRVTRSQTLAPCRLHEKHRDRNYGREQRRNQT